MKVSKVFNMLIASLFLLSILLVSGCKDKAADASIKSTPPPSTVTVSQPLSKDVVHYAEFTGTIEAVESVTIRARVEGYLEKIHFNESALVNRGDQLFSIDQQPYLAALNEAKADLASAESELRIAKATKIRKENALLDNAVSEVDVIDARARLGKAEAGIMAARAAVQKAQLNLSYTRITAPISGRISRSVVDEGNLVGAGERTILTTILNDNQVYAYFNINERDWIEYQVGRNEKTTNGIAQTSVDMGLAGCADFPYKGTLDFIDNRIDSSTGTIQVRAIFNNPQHRIVPGLFARIRIPVGATSDALLVPDSALGFDQQGRFILLADKNNITEYRPVTVGELVGDMRVIKSGIKVNERIIINGLQKTRPGAPVSPQEIVHNLQEKQNRS